MITKFFTGFVANVSEEVLVDLFKVIVKEITLARKKADLSHLIAELKVVIDETAGNETISIDEKNARLTVVGRAVVERLRNK